MSAAPSLKAVESRLDNLAHAADDLAKVADGADAEAAERLYLTSRRLYRQVLRGARHGDVQPSELTKAFAAVRDAYEKLHGRMARALTDDWRVLIATRNVESSFRLALVP